MAQIGESQLIESDVFTDDELTGLALSADPDRPIDTDAVPFTGQLGNTPELLPAWYMPVPATVSGRRSHRVVAAVVIAAFGVINAAGLCITYGYLTIA